MTEADASRCARLCLARTVGEGSLTMDSQQTDENGAAEEPAPSPAGARQPGLRLVLDTNVFVAAGFNPHSHSARILEWVRQGAWTMVWNRQTRRETEAVLAQIPPLAHRQAETPFHPEDEFTAETHPERMGFIEDPEDRKFAALAAAAGAILVTNDDHLLSQRDAITAEVLTPGEVMARYGQE